MMAASIETMFPLYHISLAAAPVMGLSPQDTNIFSHIRLICSYKKRIFVSYIENLFCSPYTLSAPLGRPSPWKVFIGTGPGFRRDRGFVISPCRLLHYRTLSQHGDISINSL